MSNGSVAPPNTEEVDIGPSGTQLGTQGVTADSNIDSIPAVVEGTIHVATENGKSVSQFGVVKILSGGQKQTIMPITKIQIPYGGDTLTVENDRGTAKWTFKSASVPTNATALDWRSDMVTPSGTQVTYWEGATQTDLQWSEFDEMKLTVDT